MSIKRLIGSAPNQVSRNKDLGTLAFQSRESASVGILSVDELRNNNGILVSTDGSSAALRITQTGAGNALVVEDSANPDSTPFMIGSGGQLVRGHTAGFHLVNPYTGSANGPQMQTVGATIADASVGSALFVNNAGQAAYYALAKTRGASIGDMATLQNGDRIGYLSWQGSDGTNFIRAADIYAAVDGTPGTNDMPGRLVFSTTADGSASPTERMRISQHGGVSIGGSGAAQVGLYNQRNISGNATSYANLTLAFVQSDVTSNAYGYRTDIGTAAASFTAGSIQHFSASQTTFGAGSTVTNQYGFSAENDLTGATNNYGFHSNIASGTGRWNFYAAGTADNYFAGKVGIGFAPDHAILGAVGGATLPSPTTDATGDAYGTLTLGNTGGTAASGAFSAGIAFTGINTTRRRAFIGAVQDTADGDQFGLQFFTRAQIATTNNALNGNYALHLTYDNQVKIASDGGLVISKTAVTAPEASDGNVFSGTYTPTLTNTTNVAASTAYVCQYMRVGNVVTVSGRVDIDPTATGGTELRMTLPIASAMTLDYQVSGTFSSSNSNGGQISAETTADIARFIFSATDVANRGYYFTFTYRII